MIAALLNAGTVVALAQGQVGRALGLSADETEREGKQADLGGLFRVQKLMLHFDVGFARIGGDAPPKLHIAAAVHAPVAARDENHRHQRSRLLHFQRHRASRGDGCILRRHMKAGERRVPLGFAVDHHFPHRPKSVPRN